MLRHALNDVGRVIAVCCAPGFFGLLLGLVTPQPLLATFIFLTWTATGCEIMLGVVCYECWRAAGGGKGERRGAGDAEDERQEGERQGAVLIPPVANVEHVLDAIADEHEEA